jgi:hypothetical protein
MFEYLYPDEQYVKQLDIIIRQEQEAFVGLTVAPIIQQQEYDQQHVLSLQKWQVSYDEVDAIVIWQIPNFVAPSSAMAATLNISKRQRYWAPKAAMMELFPVELPQYAVGVVTGWDSDAEHQFLRPPSFSSDSSGEVESINIVVIPAAFDTDADQQFAQDPYLLDREISDPTVETILTGIFQFTWDDASEWSKSQPEYYKDHLMDEGVEKVFLPSQFFDTDADQQRAQEPYQLDRDVTDAGVENIILIPIRDFSWDDSAEWQQLNPLQFSSDTLMDEGVELITIPIPIVDFTWDNDAEQQFLQPRWYQDAFDGTEAYTQVPITLFILATGGVTPASLATGGAISEPILAGGIVELVIDVDGDII